MKIRNYLIIFFISMILLYLAFRQINFFQILKIISRPQIVFAGLLFLLSCILQYFVRAWRWGILLKKYKTDLKLGMLFKSTLLGFFISYTLPGRLGEFFRPIYLAQKEKISKSQALATVVQERILDALFIFLIFLCSLPLMSSQMENILLRKLFVLVLAGSAMIIVSFLLLEIVLRTRGEAVLKKVMLRLFFFLPARWKEKIIAILLKFILALRFDLNKKDMINYLLLTILFQLCIVPFYWLLNLAFEGMKLSFPAIAVYFMFIYIAAAIPTPGMAGSWDFASRLALTELFAVSAEVAVAYTLFAHFLVILFPIAAGFFVFWKEGLNWKRIKQTGSEDALS